MGDKLMDVLLTKDHVVLKNSTHTLWCARRDGRLVPGYDVSGRELDSAVLLGNVWGCIGKIRFFSDAEWKLLLISHASSVGTLPQGGEVYCIENIAIIPLIAEGIPEVIGLEPLAPSTNSTDGPPGSQPPLSGWLRGAKGGKDRPKELRDREKLERRLTDALLWMFNGSRSFYFSWEVDLTQTLQRQAVSLPADLQQLPLWQRVDERFFWNRWMLSDLIGDNYPGAIADPWIIPIVQGYIDMREIPLREPSDAPQAKKLSEDRGKRDTDLRDRGVESTVDDDIEMVEVVRDPPVAILIDEVGALDKRMRRRGRAKVPKIGPSTDGYESDSETSSCCSQDTDDILDTRYEKIYSCLEGEPLFDEDLPGDGDEGNPPWPSAQLDQEGRDGYQTIVAEGDGREEVRELPRDLPGDGDDGNPPWPAAQLDQEERDGDQTIITEGGEREEGRELSRDLPRDGDDGNPPWPAAQLDQEERDGDQTIIAEGGEREEGREIPRDLPGDGDEGNPPWPAAQLDQEEKDSDQTTIAEGGEREEGRELPRDLPGDGDDGSPPWPAVQLDQEEKDGDQTIIAEGGEREEGRELTLEGEKESEGGEDSGTTAVDSYVYQQPDLGEREGGSPQLHDSTVSHQGPPSNPTGDSSATNSSQEPHKLEEDDSCHLTPVEGDRLPSIEDRPTHEERDGSPSAESTSEDVPSNQLSAGAALPEAPVTLTTEQDISPEQEGEALPVASDVPLPEQNGEEVDGEPMAEMDDLVDGGRIEVREGERTVRYHLGQTEEKEKEERKVPTFTLAMISRRSRHRAGTRYRRRGVDVDGHVANYVETEMIIKVGKYQVSYVIVRGSVPVYWTQPGYKYRPPPIIEKGDEETQEAFSKHFEQQLNLYKEMAIVNLVNSTGREGVMGEAFEKHLLLLNSPLLTYVTFDFHHRYKADPHQGAQLLLSKTEGLIKKFKFCWVDTTSGTPLCKQEGVFRVNCMDCLDRTNVIQTLFAQNVLQTALHKLSVIPFEEQLGGPPLTTYKEMWANNGDFLSIQYTGTAAMKGDLTRYGERKISGMMKDGYNSAHRYYQNIFRDTYRQVLIDLMQGCAASEAFASLPRSMRLLDEDMVDSEVEEEVIWSLDREQAIADMIQRCKHILFPNKSLHVQGWALMEAAGYSFLESSQKEEECVLMQCRERSQLCVANYNREVDQVMCFIGIPMNRIEKVVVGPLGTLLRTSKRLHLRIYYSLLDHKTCYLTFKTVFFTSMEEDKAILLSIATALSYIEPTITVHEQKLTKKRSPPHDGVVYLVLPEELTKDWLVVDQSSSRESSLEIVGKDEIDGLEEDELEQSFSAPSSPKLPRKCPVELQKKAHRRMRSQSFDDIISSINNEEAPPMISVTMPRSPAKKSTGIRHFLLESDSGSEFDVDSCEISTMTSRSAEDIRKDLEDSTESTQPQGGGAFTRLKGRFLRKVKRGASKFQSQLYASSSTGALSTQETEDSDVPQTKPQVSQMLWAMGQKFRNSPSLLRKVGVNRRSRSPQPQTSEEDVRRKDDCKSRFIEI